MWPLIHKLKKYLKRKTFVVTAVNIKDYVSAFSHTGVQRTNKILRQNFRKKFNSKTEDYVPAGNL
jgi:hypothetical protein